MVHIFHKMNLTDYKSGERFRSINYCCMKQLDSIHEQFRILAFEESPSVVQSTYSRPVVGTVSALVVGIPFGFAAFNSWKYHVQERDNPCDSQPAQQ